MQSLYYEAMTKKGILKILIVGFVGALLIRVFIFEGFVVSGDSMAPTLKSGDYVLINKLSYLFGTPERGDIIVAYSQREGVRLVKRVMGLPYEWFDIDGKTSNVDPQEYFLVGDNKEVSIDSRILGNINDWDVEGRVFGAMRFKTLKYISF